MRLPFRPPPAAGKRVDVVGQGLNSVDWVALVPDFPRMDTHQRLDRLERVPGGQVATAMVGCARLGCRASYVGRFGDDPDGRFVRESLEREGVDVSASVHVPGASNRIAVILVDARSGARTVLWARHPALAMRPEEVSRAVVTAGRLLLVDAQDVEASTQAARYARQAAVPTVIDIDEVKPGVAELLAEIDAVIAAREVPSALTGHQDLGRALRAMADQCRAPLVCATLGSEGSLAFCQGREIRTHGFPVACADTTGAGDVFRAGFMAAVLEAPDADLEGALAYANAAAALTCRSLGAREGIPRSPEVEEFLAAHSKT